jgi:glycosyl transferase family 25
MNEIKLDKTNTFCISLNIMTQRKEKMKKRFEYFDMDVTFVDASTPENLTDRFDSKISLITQACAQSHINLWKYILNNNIDYALILEDDACFDKEWKKKLDSFILQKNDTDLLCLMLNASEPMQQVYNWEECKEQYLAAGYIITKKGCHHILNMFKNCFFTSDWMLSRMQNLGHCYCYYPWLIIQEGNESTIGSNVEADHAKVVRCLSTINYSLDNYY